LKIPKFCDKFKISWQKANIFTYLFLSELISRVFFLDVIVGSPNPFVVILIVVVLVAIVEVLVPRVVTIVLGRRPIVVFSETANTVKVKAF